MSEAVVREQLIRPAPESAHLKAAGSRGTDTPDTKLTRNSMRRIASVLCIVISTLLIPVSVVASWASLRLVDESAFVETFAPLANDEDIQDAVILQITDMLDSAIDIEGLTDTAFDGIGEFALPSRAAAAFDLLRGPTASGLHRMLESGVSDFVRSELFAGAWESSLRLSHRALIATVQGSALNGSVTVSSEGELAIQLRPVLEQVQSSLIDSGFSLLSTVPSFTSLSPSLVIAHSGAFPIVSLAYSVTTVAGWWFPVIALTFLSAGVLFAVRRPAAILGSGIALAMGGGILLAALAVGEFVARGSSAGMTISTSAISAVFDQTVSGMRGSSRVLVALGIAVAVLGWTRGSSRPAHALRGMFSRLNLFLRSRMAEHGISTGSFGRWVSRNGAFAGVIVLIGAVSALVLLPFSTSTIFWVTVFALLVWWGLTLCGPAVSKSKSDDSAD